MEGIFETLPLLSLIITLVTLYLSLCNFRKRMELEDKLRMNLIKEINKKNIDLKNLKTHFSDNKIKIEIYSHIHEDSEEKYIKELDECITLAIEHLMDNEKIIIRRAIDNSIQNGRVQYKEKVINDSISKLLDVRTA
ncbi:hypothetical protein HS327_01977 [Glaesserella parasuis]|uniref:hypothetical protein n=1 Tax=Glaesserella parasuis TaxID=738 RepID=UPI0004DD19B5|nr:hypothetical protein [Glaesserella parasuis]KEZ17240.1 hypothetical protein HS327_01977 [Glaesserella parasuis]